jgi:transmembrane sensor
MKKTEINSIDDLIANESFRKWIMEKSEEDAIFWNQWIEQNPSRIEWVAAAKAIMAGLTDETTALSDEQIDQEAERIQQRIFASRTGVGARLIHFGSRSRLFRLKAVSAAAVILFIVLGTILYRQHASALSPKNAYESFLQDTRNKNIEYNNGTDSVQRILLSDGSEVLLEKNSQLSYASNFTSGKREVYLSGAAFFSIARDPAKPFIVYTQRIVAKVLGTSFRINAGANEQTASVEVRTGKVSVFSRENFTRSGAESGALKGIVLTPNQEMVYDVAQEQMSKTLAEAPVMTKDSVSDFVFDDTPVTEVFKKLQDAYGITILLDEEVMASCSISASMGNEPFYEKLNMICKVINATYQVIDGNVVINARGCR